MEMVYLDILGQKKIILILPLKYFYSRNSQLQIFFYRIFLLTI